MNQIESPLASFRHPEHISSLFGQAAYFMDKQVKARAFTAQELEIKSNYFNRTNIQGALLELPTHFQIYYRDSVPPWSGNLVEGSADGRLKAYAILHETGHILVRTTEAPNTSPSHMFYDEQAAILGGHLLQSALEVPPLHPIERPDIWVQKNLPLEDRTEITENGVKRYACSPLAVHIYETEGSARRYKTPDGIIRMDGIADTVVEAKPHFEDHFRMLELFGIAARALTESDWLFGQAIAQLGKFQPAAAHQLADCSPETRAKEFLIGWWTTENMKNRYTGRKEQHNFYLDQTVSFASKNEALSHGQSIRNHILGSCQRDPENPFARLLVETIRKQEKTSAPDIALHSAVRCKLGQPSSMGLNLIRQLV